jgi:hypothetical protein
VVAAAAYAVAMLQAAALQNSLTTGIATIDIMTPVVTVLDLVIRVAVLGTTLFALVHSIAQRADAFPAAGKLSKPAWLGINAAAFLLALLAFRSPIGWPPSLFAIIAITASLVYIVDVRPAVREVSGGGGSSPW